MTSPLVNKNKLRLEYILLGTLLAFIVLIRLRLLSFPLERDEGEYAYMGSLILDGIAPYKEAYNMKFPGTYFLYAFNMLLFGKTIEGIHLGLLWANLLTTFFVFLFAKKLWNASYGIIAATVFGLTSLSPSVLGFAAHATHFVMLFAIAGLYVTYLATASNKPIYYAFGGFLLGCAPLMKQSGFVFPIMGAILVFLHHQAQLKAKEYKPLILPFAFFVIAGLCPLLFTAFYLYSAVVWDKFIFWTVTYAQDYGNQMKGGEGMQNLKRTLAGLFSPYLMVWIISGIGLVSTFLFPEKKKLAILLLCFGVLSFISVSLGSHYRQHYFIQYLPALGILFAAALYALESYLSRITKANIVPSIKWIVLGIVAIVGIAKENKYLFQQNVNKLCKSIYGANPFVESIELAKYIKQNTKPNDKIAVFGSEPQLFFYSERKSATGYIYMYSLMEDQPNNLKMQHEMANEVEKAKPEMIVVANIATSWLFRPESERFILDWYRDYIYKNDYKLVGMVNVFAQGSNFLTGADLNMYTEKSKDYLLVYKK